MSRRRKNDPVGVSDCPNITTDPDREKIITGEFRRRLDYACWSYSLWQKTLGPPSSFNESLRLLKRSMNVGGLSDEVQQLLHPEIKIAISYHAKACAAKRTGVTETLPIPEDREAGARRVLSLVKPRRGRPDDRILRHHVEGLMALIQHTLGKPVMMQPATNSVYDPQATSEAGELLLMLAKRMEPTITKIAVVNIVNKARRRYAGKQMRYSKFFPAYGAKIVEFTGNADSASARSQSR